MIVFPAIDIKDGKCVRLIQGRFDQQTVFSDLPAAVAARWRQEGAEYLHLVDLDGARDGARRNTEVIREILRVDIPVQFGGGIRDMQAIEQSLECGVARVILGSAAVKKPALVKEACKRYGDRIMVAVDAWNDEVAVEGWAESGGIKAGELAKRMADAGVGRIIYTDIARDGKLSGANIEATARIARQSGLKVIASGGVSAPEDIIALQQYEQDGIEGFIVGKALYTGHLHLPEAIKLARGK